MNGIVACVRGDENSRIANKNIKEMGMQRRKYILIFTIMVFVMVLGISNSFAVLCPPGKVPSTIVNPAGKIIELCVPEAAVEHIGGNGDVVIPGSCPCYSQDDLDAIWADPNFLENLHAFSKIGTGKFGGICTRTLFYDDFYKYIFYASEGPIETNEGECQWGEWQGGTPPDLGVAFIDHNNLCYHEKNRSEYDLQFLGETDGDACVAILNSFLPK